MLWGGRQWSRSEGLITIPGAASCLSGKYPQNFPKHMYQVTYQLSITVSSKPFEKHIESEINPINRILKGLEIWSCTHAYKLFYNAQVYKCIHCMFWEKIECNYMYSIT